MKPRSARAPFPLAVRLVAVAALAALATAPKAARAGEIVESYDDGTVKCRYTVDAEERRHGAYLENYPSGKPKVRARYAKGALDGPHVEYHENGKPSRKATYEDGALEGKVAYFDDRGKTLREEVWQKGRLLFPRSKVEIARALAEIAAAKVVVPGPPKDPAPPEVAPLDFKLQAEALRRLRAYRWLCGVADDVELSWEQSEVTTAAVRLLELVNDLTHTPSRPPGASDLIWEKGRLGCESSNLDPQPSPVRSVDDFMYDSDSSNIDRVGHRRWCLSPKMTMTAWGSHASRTAMMVTDQSRKGPDPEWVAYPAPGWFPTTFIQAGAAWSLHLDLARFAPPRADAVKVTVRPADDRYRRGPPAELDYFNVANDSYGGGPAVIFRPKVPVRAGHRYWVEVEGLTDPKGGAKKVEYLVEFL
jgi:hypothetical protein